MHIDTVGPAIALAIMAHAWISKLSGPPAVVNAVAWVMVILITLVVVFGGLVVR